MSATLLAETKSRLQAARDSSVRRINGFRLVATPAMVEMVPVVVNGPHTAPLKDLATITALDNFNLLVRPANPEQAKAIRKALEVFPAGFSVMTENDSFRLTLAILTEERRKAQVQYVQQLAEEGRLLLRNLRREAFDSLKEAAKSGGRSASERKNFEAEIQTLMDEAAKGIAEALAQKEKEFLRV